MRDLGLLLASAATRDAAIKILEDSISRYKESKSEEDFEMVASACSFLLQKKMADKHGAEKVIRYWSMVEKASKFFDTEERKQ